jgi:hypothetical protein
MGRFPVSDAQTLAHGENEAVEPVQTLQRLQVARDLLRMREDIVGQEHSVRGEQARLAGLERWEELSGYAVIQGTRPQTLAYALADSPVGQLAWYADWFAAHGEKVGVLDRDAVLTNVMLYWLTGTAGSAARLYKEMVDVWEPAERSPVPMGVAVFPGDPPSAVSSSASTT